MNMNINILTILSIDFIIKLYKNIAYYILRYIINGYSTLTNIYLDRSVAAANAQL